MITMKFLFDCYNMYIMDTLGQKLHAIISSRNPSCKLPKTYREIKDLFLHCETVPCVLDAECATKKEEIYTIMRAASCVLVLADVPEVIKTIVAEADADLVPPIAFGKSFAKSGTKESQLLAVKVLQDVSLSHEDVLNHPTHSRFGGDGTSAVLKHCEVIASKIVELNGFENDAIFKEAWAGGKGDILRTLVQCALKTDDKFVINGMIKSLHYEYGSKRPVGASDALFDECIEELVDFKEIHSHCDLSSSSKEYKSLGIWCTNTRSAYNGKGTMTITEDRIRRL